jgi:hypothetical protein
MRAALAAPSSVTASSNTRKEGEMRRIAHTGMGIRIVLVTLVISLLAAIEPIVALAGQGNPTGS